jgi:transcriptional antiterminator RfaH
MKSWYVVHTKPRQEARAEVHLQRQGFSCYLPYIKQQRKRNQQSVASVEPLFPRYLFIRLNLLCDNIAPIRSTQGATGLVCFGGQPAAVPAPFITALQNATGACGYIEPAEEAPFNKGERVVIETGPLAGLTGIFQATTSHERVIVLLELLGGQNKVTLASNAIARVA